MTGRNKSLILKGAAVVGGVSVLLTGLFLVVYLRSPSRGLPYHDGFAAGKAEEWQAFGGTWEVVNSEMRNDSDERGAKFLTGSTRWRNYSIEADMMLLGMDGDAGLIARSSNEEEGVDSYTGYYLGLRNRDNSLVLGRAEHGWIERSKKLVSAPGGIQPFQWYHLKLLVYGCQIVGTATSSSQPGVTAIGITEKNCAESGRVGLRSYSSGGVWKHVVVHPAEHHELDAMLAVVTKQDQANAQSQTPNAAEPGQYPSAGSAERSVPGSGINVRPISDLRLFPFTNKVTATVRGVVTLTSPTLIVQDATGGVSVPRPHSPPLKIGDEVEVSGRVHPSDFSSALEDATVRVLWARSPMPAVSVTASQAATGAFDANFVELKGYLRRKQFGPNNTLVLEFDAGPEPFRVIMNRGRNDSFFKEVKLDSLLRLRGVCVVDPEYTQNLTPFVLLLRSTDDLEVMAGPPWWSTGHLVALVIGLLMLALVINFFYGRIEHWRLRAVLEERERFAHEMHDTLAQSFAGIGFQLDAIRNGVPAELALVHRQLDLASDLARHSHEEARRSIATLRPASLDSEDLTTALESCARRMVEGGNVRVVTTCGGNIRRMPLRVTDTLYRIGQEAVANAVGHAHPTEITVAVEYRRNSVSLMIADDGIGFRQADDLRGLGLQGMRRRAASISATLDVVSTPGQGTRISTTAPLPPRTSIISGLGRLWTYLRDHRPNAQEIRQQHSHSYRG
jgi:signal transduction histidine kinase